MTDPIEAAIEAWFTESTEHSDGDFRARMEAAISAYHDAEIEALRKELADCRAVLRERGHEIWCGSNNCGHLYAGGFCGIGRDAHGPNGAVHEFIARHKCTCGYDRVMGEG